MSRFILTLFTCLSIQCTLFAADAHYQFELIASSGLSKNSPVWITLPSGIEKPKSLALKTETHPEPISLQSSEDGKRAAFLLPASLAADESQLFEMIITDHKQKSAAKVIQEEDQISFQLHGTDVLAYQTSVVEPPQGLSELYRRSGHIHPFVTPSGRVITDGFPVDHMHQHAIFAAWTKTFFEGERVDFWNQKAGTGTVLHKEVLNLQSGPVFASAQVRLTHTVLKKTPQAVLDETWTVRLYNNSKIHLFDIESVQKCVAETPLTIAEYHYGGFALRGSAEWKGKETHDIITNETVDRKTGNHTRPNWVSIYGKVQEELCGAAMFSHPTNFRSPQPVRLHPSMPYFVYAPSVLGEFDLKPSVPYETRNRYLAFDGPPKKELLDALWNDYSQTPKIVWKEVE